VEGSWPRLGRRRGRTGQERGDVLVRLGDDAMSYPPEPLSAFATRILRSTPEPNASNSTSAFIRLDEGQHVSTLDAVPLLLQPLQEPPFFHGNRRASA